MVVMHNHRHLTGFWQMLAFFSAITAVVVAPEPPAISPELTTGEHGVANVPGHGAVRPNVQPDVKVSFLAPDNNNTRIALPMAGHARHHDWIGCPQGQTREQPNGR
jgi:hypothetical protein